MGGGAPTPLATRSYPAARARAEEECALRTSFQRDRDRIVHCKAFRQLKHKTQVFVAREGDHYRTPLTHIGIAETGTVCVAESEGNGRMCTTLPEVLVT